MATDRQACYDSLPVVLPPSAKKDYLASRGAFDHGGDIQFFLEPHSRRLKIDSVQTDCARPFPATYQTMSLAASGTTLFGQLCPGAAACGQRTNESL